MLLRLLAEDDILGLHGGAEVGLDDGVISKSMLLRPLLVLLSSSSISCKLNVMARENKRFRGINFFFSILGEQNGVDTHL